MRKSRDISLPAGLPPILTLEEVANWLSISLRFAESLQQRGMPSLDLGERTHRYEPQEVLGWLREQRSTRQQHGSNAAGLHPKDNHISMHYGGGNGCYQTHSP